MALLTEQQKNSVFTNCYFWRYIAIFLSLLFFTSCTFPNRMGYDRKIGAYKSAKSENKTNPATEPAPKKATSKVSKQVASPSKKYSSLREYTNSWVGTKYVYGGSSRKGTDCSGYMMNVFRDVYGVSLPHSAATIYKDDRFKKVDRSDLKEGDLVFFGDLWGISHVGVSMGGEEFSHASTSKGVMYSKLSEKYYNSRYKGARRLKR